MDVDVSSLQGNWLQTWCKGHGNQVQFLSHNDEAAKTSAYPTVKLQGAILSYSVHFTHVATWQAFINDGENDILNTRSLTLVDGKEPK